MEWIELLAKLAPEIGVMLVALWFLSQAEMRHAQERRDESDRHYTQISDLTAAFTQVTQQTLESVKRQGEAIEKTVHIVDKLETQISRIAKRFDPDKG